MVSGIATAKVTDMVRDGRRLAGLTDGAARQGWYGGLVLGLVNTMMLFVANLVMSPAQELSSDRFVGLALPALYAVGFVLIGARGQQRTEIKWAGARAGAIAGLIVAALFVVTFGILFNVFYATMIQQPGHLGATRASLNGTLLGAGLFVPLFVTSVAALLGEFGGSFVVAWRAWRPIR